jgi:hypothetical protein
MEYKGGLKFAQKRSCITNIIVSQNISALNKFDFSLLNTTVKNVWHNGIETRKIQHLACYNLTTQYKIRQDYIEMMLATTLIHKVHIANIFTYCKYWPFFKALTFSWSLKRFELFGLAHAKM